MLHSLTVPHRISPPNSQPGEDRPPLSMDPPAPRKHPKYSFSCPAKMRSLTLPLLLIGTAGFLWVQIREHWRSLLIDREIRQVKAKARTLGGSSPAKVEVVGLQHHGKSSFINSVFRVMYREEGKLVLRTETGPLCAMRTTVKHKAYDVLESPDGLHGSTVLLTLIDSPALSILRPGDRRMTVPVTGCKGTTGCGSGSIPREDLFGGEFLKPDCVVVCVNCAEVATDHVGFVLEKISSFFRSAGIPFVVAMTHRDMALSAGLPVGSLVEFVSTKTSSNAVFCLSNYVETPWQKSDGLNNSFESHRTMILLLKQVLEFCRQRRQQTSSIL